MMSWLVCHDKSAFIVESAGTPGDSSIVKLLVGEIRAEMACNAIGLASEESQARLLGFVQRARVARHVAVEARSAGPDGSSIAGKGGCDILCGHSGAEL